MKTLLYVSLIAVAAACTARSEAPGADNNTTDTINVVKTEPAPVEMHQNLYGAYSGNYEKKEGFAMENDENITKATITITAIYENEATAKSLVKGVMRPMRGSWKEHNGSYSFVLAEPGDDPKDGVFMFTVSGDSLTGDWRPNDKSIAPKNFYMAKMPFKYDPHATISQTDLVDWYAPKKSVTTVDGDTYEEFKYRSANSNVISKLNASTQKLTEKQLKNLQKIELQVIRNLVYARHGFAFTNKSVRGLMEAADWYTPMFTDVEKDLTPLEKENVALLKRMEAYATDTYQQFGR